MAVEVVLVPDIGEYSDVDVIEVNVSVGDTVAEEDTLITLETDKATMEIPSPFSGVVKSLAVNEGDQVSQGAKIAELDLAGEPAAEAPKAAEPAAENVEPVKTQAPAEAPAPAQAVAAEVEPVSGADAHASPAVRRYARELGVDLTQVSATGRKGRVTHEDVQRLVKSVMQGGGQATGTGLGLIPDPVVDFAKFGEVEVKPLPRIKKISGDNLARNWVKIPHISFFEDADITECEAFRKAKKAEVEKQGNKLTPVAFIVKAVGKALLEFPNVNSSMSADATGQVFKQYVHVGVAVDTPKGLMVPVIRDVNKKGILEIAADLLAFSQKAREGKLAPSDMQGGCFTISSLGGIGTQYFTPIVNMPEAGILGVSKAQMKPIYDGNGGFVPRLMLPLSLSVDHRLVDGAEAGRFVVAVARYLSDLRELLL